MRERPLGAKVVSHVAHQGVSQAGAPGRVLVVEDDPDTRTMLAEMLAIDGYTVRLAADGMAALTEVARWHPDVILLDLLLPGVDGWAFARAYRQTSPPRAPIIVVTATPVTPQQVAVVAPVATLRKPFNLRDLVRLVRAHVRRT